MKNVQAQILIATGNAPIISVSQKPIKFGMNICIGETGFSTYNLYKQVLIAVREAKTSYVATAEDDVLYPPEHFVYRPPANTIGYDLNKWSLFTWGKPVFSKRENRRTMTGCIAPRETLLKTLEERYTKYPVFEEIPEEIYKYYWGEPGRFEDHLGIAHVETEKWECSVPSVSFCTPEALGFTYLGKRKALGPIQAETLEPWGSAEEVRRLYEG